MEKVYVDANLKLVGAVVVYADSDSKLCEDAAHTKPISKEALRDIFLAGACCIKQGSKYEFAITGEDKGTYFMVDTESAPFYSSEYSAG